MLGRYIYAMYVGLGACSGTVVYAYNIVPQDWYDLVTKHIQSITILDQLVPSRDVVDKRVIQLSRHLASRQGIWRHD